VTESTIAYLLGPGVMILVVIAIWAVSHYGEHGDPTRHPRLAKWLGHADRGHPDRWLDTHHVDWMRHRH
jgi:hypothetical protein